MIQGSADWIKARLGRATASRISDVVARTKTGWGASRANYAAQLIAERLTGVPADSYISEAMARGTETEPDARAAYARRLGVEVIEVGFIPHPTIGMSGASPDGTIGSDGLVEIKCPNTAVHLDTLLGKSVPDKYVVQMQFQLAVTARKWVDFVSYDPRLSEAKRLFVRRFERDDARIRELEAAVVEFLVELDAKLAALDHAYPEPNNFLMAS